jgi:hypothetical protein
MDKVQKYNSFNDYDIYENITLLMLHIHSLFIFIPYFLCSSYCCLLEYLVKFLWKVIANNIPDNILVFYLKRKGCRWQYGTENLREIDWRHNSHSTASNVGFCIDGGELTGSITGNYVTE